MKKTICVLFLFMSLLAIQTGFSQVPSWYWAKSAGLTGEEYGYSVAVDKSGNTYATGSYTSATITFGAVTLTNAGAGDAFLIKFGPGGTVLWAKNIGGVAGEVGHSVEVDSAGDIYVAGWYTSATLTIGANTLTNAGASSPDLFLAKYSTNGTELWAKSAGGAGIDLCNSIAISGGNIFVAGRFIGASALIGSVTLTNAAATTNDILIAKYDSTGAVSWAKNFGGAGDDIAECVAADASGNLFLTGSFGSASVSFGTTTLTNAGTGNDMFVSRLDNSGNVSWAKSAGGTGIETGHGISVDGNGNVMVIGQFDSPLLAFGSNQLINAGYADLFLVKYDGSGALLWSISAGDQYDDAGLSVIADTAGNIYVTGKYSSATISFGTSTLNNNSGGTQDLFVCKLDPAGNEVWAISAGAVGDEIGNSIVIGKDGSIFIAGVFNSGFVTLGQTTLWKGCGNDFFVAVLSTMVGIQETDMTSALQVFPNPTSGTFSLPEKQGIRDVIIYDASGILVRSMNARSSFDLSDLPKGIYFFTITYTDKQHSGKVVLK